MTTSPPTTDRAPRTLVWLHAAGGFAFVLAAIGQLIGLVEDIGSTSAIWTATRLMAVAGFLLLSLLQWGEVARRRRAAQAGRRIGRAPGALGFAGIAAATSFGLAGGATATALSSHQDGEVMSTALYGLVAGAGLLGAVGLTIVILSLRRQQRRSPA